MDISIVRDAEAFNEYINPDPGTPSMKGRFIEGDFIYKNNFVQPSGVDALCLITVSEYSISILPFMRTEIKKGTNTPALEMMVNIPPNLREHLSQRYYDLIHREGFHKGNAHPSIQLSPERDIKIGLTGDYNESTTLLGIDLQRSINTLYQTLITATRDRGIEINSPLDLKRS